MKICALSDTHGYYDMSNIDQDTELLLIAGDVVDLDCQRYMNYSEEWFNTTFVDMIGELPKSIKQIVMVGGNHDFYLERKHKDLTELFNKLNIVYLNNRSYDYISEEGKIIKIFGSPYCKIFGNWAYMISNESLEKKFSKIPEDIDILLTHDAPYGTSDICFQDVYWNTHEHIGNIPLQKAIIEKHPKWNIHGHLHSSNHLPEKLQETNVVNVSLLDENYHITYNPFYFDL